MNGVYLLIATFFIIAVILVTVVLVLLSKHKYKKLRQEVETLDKEKNLIASTPVLSELAKVESIVKNDKMEEKYKNWQKRFEVIKDEKVNLINDMINELDISTSQKHYKNVDQKLAKVEMEIYKVRESANELLGEIKEITVSEEKYRSIVTKLKAKYRKLMNEFTTHKDDYEEIQEAIELQFENIEKRFLDFEHRMEKNEYDEVVHIPMSSGLSASCDTATMLARDYDGKVEVVNNQRISVTQRQSVLDALVLRDAGKSAAEIRAKLEEEKMESSIYITLETLKYLKKGGRITPAAAAIGTVLNLKPVLQIQGEKLDAYAKVRGKKQAKRIMMKAMQEDWNTRFKQYVESGEMCLQIAYAGNKEEAEEFKKEVEAAFPGMDIHMDPLSLSVACHIGHGALAVACSKKVTV